MVPSSYVEEIEEAYQDVPDEDESFSSEGANSGNLLKKVFNFLLNFATIKASP